MADYIKPLALCFGNNAADVHFHRQHFGQAHEHGHVVDVAVDALGDTGILDFQSQVAPVLRCDAVNLTDRGGSYWPEIKFFKTVFPF